MKTLPSLIIAADRGHFVAYEPNAEGTLIAIRADDIPEGLNKLSEQVTDKAGAFPVGGATGRGTTTATAERLTLEAEIEMQSFRKIAARIESLVKRKSPKEWGFAAPSEINGAILDGVDKGIKESLKVNLRLDLVNVPAPQLRRFFSEA